jgi:NADH:ubiquinone oxidoreductase subunit 6 (subunit J)
MNLSTHIMFGILVGALFFGRPEIMLMVGVGSAIPDLDREYGFFGKESFRRREIHRALFHNFLFIALVYFVNPYFGIGAFLHTFLDSLTTTRDRGVEWLYPFSRMVTKAVYDSDGNKLKLDPKHKIYFLQNDLPGLTRRTTKDIKPDEQPLPNRRTYGPALSGKFLDRCILFGSVALTLLLLLFSALGFQQFIDLTFHKETLSLTIPLLVGAVGVFMNFLVGELDRKKLVTNKSDKPYKITFALSVGIMIFAIILGVVMNPKALISTLSETPYIAAGITLFASVSFAVLIYSTRRFSKDNKKEPLIV